MMHNVASKIVDKPSIGWRNFGTSLPAPGETIEIRRLHDDKTILRRRADLPPSFDWRHAQWRPI